MPPKAKKEREDFENEKAEFEAKKKASEAIANAVYDLPKTIHTVSPEMHIGVDVEEQALALIQNIDSLVPELPTVNVCYDLPKAPTWDDIEKDFKASGEKSYSVWLKSNYNVPTKL